MQRGPPARTELIFAEALGPAPSWRGGATVGTASWPRFAGDGSDDRRRAPSTIFGKMGGEISFFFLSLTFWPVGRPPPARSQFVLGAGVTGGGRPRGGAFRKGGYCTSGPSTYEHGVSVEPLMDMYHRPWTSSVIGTIGKYVERDVRSWCARKHAGVPPLVTRSTGDNSRTTQRASRPKLDVPDKDAKTFVLGALENTRAYRHRPLDRLVSAERQSGLSARTYPTTMPRRGYWYAQKHSSVRHLSLGRLVSVERPQRACGLNWPPPPSRLRRPRRPAPPGTWRAAPCGAARRRAGGR